MFYLGRRNSYNLVRLIDNQEIFDAGAIRDMDKVDWDALKWWRENWDWLNDDILGKKDSWSNEELLELLMRCIIWDVNQSIDDEFVDELIDQSTNGDRSELKTVIAKRYVDIIYNLFSLFDNRVPVNHPNLKLVRSDSLEDLTWGLQSELSMTSLEWEEFHEN